MSGAVNVGVVYRQVHQQVHSCVCRTDSTPDVHIVIPLDDFVSKHRACKSKIPISTLPRDCRTYFYGKARDDRID